LIVGKFPDELDRWVVAEFGSRIFPPSGIEALDYGLTPLEAFVAGGFAVPERFRSLTDSDWREGMLRAWALSRSMIQYFGVGRFWEEGAVLKSAFVRRFGVLIAEVLRRGGELPGRDVCRLFLNWAGCQEIKTVLVESGGDIFSMLGKLAALDALKWSLEVETQLVKVCVDQAPSSRDELDIVGAVLLGDVIWRKRVVMGLLLAELRSRWGPEGDVLCSWVKSASWSGLIWSGAFVEVDKSAFEAWRSRAIEIAKTMDYGEVAAAFRLMAAYVPEAAGKVLVSRLVALVDAGLRGVAVDGELRSAVERFCSGDNLLDDVFLRCRFDGISALIETVSRFGLSGRSHGVALRLGSELRERFATGSFEVGDLEFLSAALQGESGDGLQVALRSWLFDAGAANFTLAVKRLERLGISTSLVVIMLEEDAPLFDRFWEAADETGRDAIAKACASALVRVGQRFEKGLESVNRTARGKILEEFGKAGFVRAPVHGWGASTVVETAIPPTASVAGQAQFWSTVPAPNWSSCSKAPATSAGWG
jgi:hypothetical protein